MKGIVIGLVLVTAGVVAGVAAARWFLTALQRFNSDSIWDDEDDLY